MRPIKAGKVIVNFFTNSRKGNGLAPSRALRWTWLVNSLSFFRVRDSTLLRAFVACLLIVLARRTSAASTAELAVRRANVITLDTNRLRAEAFAVAGGKFVVVGSDAQIAPFVGPATRILDLAGKTIVPGFNDAHLHPAPIYPEDSRWAAVDCTPKKVRTMDELVAALKRKAEQTPAGQWVNGSRYQETKLGRQPTRSDLDRASTNHPIIISHSSGHQSVCNSLALTLARVTRDTPDPPGGKFVRDAQGEPTGLLQERAAGMVRSSIRRETDPPESEAIAGYQECFRRYIRRGLTSVQVAGLSPSTANLMTKARTEQLPLRFYFMLREDDIDAAVKGKQDGRPDDPVHFGAIKIFHGGSLSAQTCWLSRPYVDRPDYFGLPPARSQEALDRLILDVHHAGLQAAVHSNGDREIDMLMTAFERALVTEPRANHRHRIEHASVLTEELLRRIQKVGLVIAPHSYIWEHGDKMENYGAARWDWMHAARAMLDHGIPIAGTSDSPVSAADPLLRIQDMVLRTTAEGKVYGASQRITVEEALRAWTVGSAFAEFAEERKGSITPGKFADFVVLASDPTGVKPETIKDIVIEKTFIAGRTVFEAK
jgi:predicted amidohydrolase YtcJ